MGRLFERKALAVPAAPVDTRPRWGKPTRCPACGKPGYLDTLDLSRGVMRQHCPDCWHEWETSEAETVPA